MRRGTFMLLRSGPEQSSAHNLGVFYYWGHFSVGNVAPQVFNPRSDATMLRWANTCGSARRMRAAVVSGVSTFMSERFEHTRDDGCWRMRRASAAPIGGRPMTRYRSG